LAANKRKPARTPSSRTKAAALPAGGVEAGLSQALKDFGREANRRLSGYRAGPTNVSLHFVARIDPKHEVRLEWHRVVDPDFGTLTYDGTGWKSRPRPVGEFGDGIAIRFDVPNAFERRKSRDAVPPPPRPPSAAQRRAYRSLLSEPLRWRRVVEEANWLFYQQNVRDDEDSAPGPGLDTVRSATDVWALLGDPRITVPVQAGPGWWVEFTWECDWDPEHGHQVVLRNGKSSYVGQQGGG
jgi:hypothetical protein